MASSTGNSGTSGGEKRSVKQREMEEDLSSGDSDSDTSMSVESYDEDMEIPVEFEAFPPAECDFNSMKTLLKQLFLKNAVNLSELSDLIISQDKVGSIIKIVDDESSQDNVTDDSKEEKEEVEEDEIYGLTTVLDLIQYKNEKCIQQIKDLLLEKCKGCSEAETQKKFTKILEGGKRVGLLISERLINIPPQISPPLYKALRSELEDRHKKDKSSTLEYLLLVSKSYKEKQSKKAKKGKSGKKSAKLDEEGLKEINFSNVEDEVLMKESTLSFSYPAAAAEEETLLGGKWGYDDAVLEPYRTVMVIPYKRMDAIIKQMQEFIGT